jgi:hypothetical protein
MKVDSASGQVRFPWNGVDLSLVTELVTFIDQSAIFDTENVIEAFVYRERCKSTWIKPLLWCFAGGAIDVLVVIPSDKRIELFL